MPSLFKKIKSATLKTFEILLQSTVAICSLLMVVAAVEFHIQPETQLGKCIFCAFAGLIGLVLFIMQFLFFSYRKKLIRRKNEAKALKNDLRGYKSQVRALEHRKRSLALRVEELTELSMLDTATVRSDSFDDFMNTIARLARDNSGARELTVFTCDNQKAYPLACYQLSKATEVCLSFNPAGAAVLAADIIEFGNATPSNFSARSMNTSQLGKQLIITGELLYSGAPAGRLRLTILESDPETPPARSALRRLVINHLSAAAIDSKGILSAINNDSPVPAGGDDNVNRLATSLRMHSELLGVIRMGFCNQDGINLYDQQKSLLATASRVAVALRHEKIYEQAIKDSLTGLFNKRHMMTSFEQHLKLAARKGHGLCMILIDIDHFKKVNDTWGHLTGDIILREVGAIMAINVRSCDIPCRYGGEELAILLPDSDLNGTVQLAERLRTTIEQREFISDKGQALHITASFGVSEYHRGIGQAEDMISEVDHALYEAKHNGRNQVVVARPDNQALA